MSGVLCPKCNKEVQQEFGIVTCPHCTHVFMIDMNGEAAGLDNLAPAPIETPEILEMNPQVEVSPSELPPALPSENESVEAVITPAAEAPMYTGEAPIELPALGAEPDLQSVIKEIQDFGNGELTVSPLSYALKISGIDRMEIREELAEALTDAKFNLDSNRLISEIKDGTIEILQLNPVKASLIVQKLRRLPITISWTQSIYDPQPAIAPEPVPTMSTMPAEET